VRFLVDAQLPPELALWLVTKGHEARHVFDLGMATAEDDEIWARAVADHAILITKDGDFTVLRQRLRTGPAVIWLRIGNAANRTLIAWVDERYRPILSALDAGESIIEVR
jgi:predicted nuclease of predicted toxin-antitoxin system